MLPPPVFGSPAELPPEPLAALRPEHSSGVFDPTTPWWRPGAAEIARAIGWWWLLLAPAAALAIAIPIVAIMFGNSTLAGQIANVIKLSAFLAAVAVTIVIRAARSSVQMRRGAFCIHCGYTLEGLPGSGTCPECGREYRESVINEFRKDPHFFAARSAIVGRAPRFEPFVAGRGPTPDDGTR